MCENDSLDLKACPNYHLHDTKSTFTYMGRREKKIHKRVVQQAYWTPRSPTRLSSKSNHTFHVRHYIEEKDILPSRLKAPSYITLKPKAIHLSQVCQLTCVQMVTVETAP
jgi:hypothetical protein